MPPFNQVFQIVLTPVRLAGRVVGGVLGGGQDDGRQEQQEEPRQEQRRPQRRSGPQKADPQRDRAPKPLDDVALARKVESVIFRDKKAAKGKIDVNAADGVVWLRGEAKTPDLIKELERRTEAVPEVKSVENLLHLPKTPAPSRTDTPATQRKTRRTPRKQADRKVTAGKVTEEKPPAGAEPSPKDTARSGEGRPSSPLEG